MACQKGDAEAFAVLVERHQKKMLNVAFRMTGDYDEACDITQEAFISAYQSIRRFKGESKFSSWLCRIVINHSKNRLKQLRNRDRRANVSIDDPGDPKKEEVVQPSLIHDGDPGTQMEKREREIHVQNCINSLDDEHREVLVLRDIQGLSYEEICNILKVADGTVKSRLSRARNALKNCLAKVMGDL